MHLDLSIIRCITPAIGSRVQVVLLLQRESVVIVAVPVPHHVVNAMTSASRVKR
jgi:hypothetical protein